MKSRLMTDEDIASVERLEKLCFSSPWSRDEIKATFLREDSIYCIAEKEGVVIAYAAFFFVLEEANIINIAVDPEYRRQGVANKLMEFVMIQIAKQSLEKVILEVRESNVAAIELYKAFGFKSEGVRKNFYEKPTENGIVMISTIC